jgi:protein involved in polysaccharide export with SLBB domain
VENPRFVVEPLLRVSVSGQVDRPNLYTVAPGTTVAQAVAQAGGVTDQGRQDRVRLVRNQAERFVNLTDPRDGSQPVRSGDEIFVGPRSQWFRGVFVPTATIVGAIASLILAIRRSD